MVINSYYSYNWLDHKQRLQLNVKWSEVVQMFEKWKSFTVGDGIALYANKKSLQKEIEDLEDLSMAAYQAMKLLRKQIKDNEQIHF